MKPNLGRGDDGSTDLYGGMRAQKDDARMEAIGTVDEVNAVLGLGRAACRFPELAKTIEELQNLLFDVGADLATPVEGGTSKAAANVQRISTSHVGRLEELTREVEVSLPAMKYFILPGGSELAARLHQARTVCRRAERVCVALARRDAVTREVIVVLNRLSDLLFAMARKANQLESVADVAWRSNK